MVAVSYFTFKIVVRALDHDKKDNLLLYSICTEYAPKAVPLDAVESLLEVHKVDCLCHSVCRSMMLRSVNIWSMLPLPFQNRARFFLSCWSTASFNRWMMIFARILLWMHKSVIPRQLWAIIPGVMMAGGHAKIGTVSVALKLYLLALFVGSLYHSESNKTRHKPSHLFARDRLPMITALLANQPVVCDNVKHRGKHYLPGRILHTSNGTSSFQIEKHLLICGDVSSNPGPSEKPKAKYPCGECHKNVRNNQDAILCAICKSWFHAKCLNMSRNIFRYYLAHSDIDWMCALCSLPPLSDSFFSEDSVRFGQTEFSVDMHDRVLTNSEPASQRVMRVIM